MGSLSLHLTFAVCALYRPVFGCHPIMRQADDAWTVLPVRYCRAWSQGVERLVGLNCPIGDLMAPGAQLILCNAPDAVNAALELL